MAGSEYGEWLDRLYSSLPKGSTSTTRFEPPKPQVAAVGNRTFIKNFKQLCAALNRECQQLMRYMVKELATAGSIEEDQAVFQGKFNGILISRIVDDYIKEYVLCPVCSGPDTKVIREERFRFLVCEACGARSSVRAI